MTRGASVAGGWWQVRVGVGVVQALLLRSTHGAAWGQSRPRRQAGPMMTAPCSWRSTGAAASALYWLAEQAPCRQ